MPRPHSRHIGEIINGSVIVDIDSEQKQYTLECTRCGSARVVTFVTIHNVIRSKESCAKCRLGRWGKVGGAREAHFSRLKTLAKQRGKDWTLTLDEFSRLIGDTCFYCGSLGTERKSWDGKSTEILCGIDRVDSSFGYTAENIVPCCGVCNRAKHTMSQQEFLLWIKRLVEFRR